MFQTFFQGMKKCARSTPPRGRFPTSTTRSSRKLTSSRSVRSTWTRCGEEQVPDQLTSLSFNIDFLKSIKTINHLIIFYEINDFEKDLLIF